MKITLLNDLSAYGNCSLAANIPVLNVLGHETHAFPTAILSNQTAYDSFFIKDTSRYFDDYVKEWDKLGERTDCVYAGFSVDGDLPLKAADLAEKYGAMFFFDPVLGDKGGLYKCFDEGFVARYRAAAARADYITPNFTEACLLAGENYFSFADETDETAFKKRLANLAQSLCDGGAKNAVVTGAEWRGKLFNGCFFNGEPFIYECEFFKKSYSGTGDLFDSVFLGYLLNGATAKDCVAKASDFLSTCIACAMERGIDSRRGVDFTPFLKNLR
ncbi:MAG: hypothetical protein DBX59_09045 [Bacillota bacterium]|nr:MAG: hypothetical protein DBX59_09045 [Bacillota bacterium]